MFHKCSNRIHVSILTAGLLSCFWQCREQPSAQSDSVDAVIEDNPGKTTNMPSNLLIQRPDRLETPEGMVWIPGGSFEQGAVPEDRQAMSHEKPPHPVLLDGFFMDIHEVTNGQYEAFVKETGYITVAEREVDWEQLKKQLPEDTPRPADSVLQPGSLVFIKTREPVPNLYDFSQWWQWRIGANWKHPHGPGTSIKGMGDYPVVHIAYEDALAYCEWAGRRLPTEAEWEYAGRGGKEHTIFSWGNEEGKLPEMANTWNGQFPVFNDKTDGYEGSAPVMSYPANGFGLYDMAGNVWEWTSDWYDNRYYETFGKTSGARNPDGPDRPHNPSNPYAAERVIKGGSFLCSASYCASYRLSSRMATSMDSGLEHLGFRTVWSPGKTAQFPRE